MSQRDKHALRLDGETPRIGRGGESQSGRGVLLRRAGVEIDAQSQVRLTEDEKRVTDPRESRPTVH